MLLLVVIARSVVAGSSSVQRQPFLFSPTSDQFHSLRQTLALSLRGGGSAKQTLNATRYALDATYMH